MTSEQTRGNGDWDLILLGILLLYFEILLIEHLREHIPQMTLYPLELFTGFDLLFQAEQSNYM